VLYKVGESLLALLTPILPFTMDEFNLNLPGKRKENSQYLGYPSYREVNEDILKEYEDFKLLRDDVLKALEEARVNKVLGSSQEALVLISFKNEALKTLFNTYESTLRNQVFVVSEIKESHNEGVDYKNAQIEVLRHQGHFCARCWNYENEAIVQKDDTYLCRRCHQVIHDE
ncbi:MAG: class I tRNA ligase family protein, partial [Erysipelotrichia bacterium]|nr:class I tRNA ligase family protein [Erysipelotrichia bacterium]